MQVVQPDSLSSNFSDNLNTGWMNVVREMVKTNKCSHPQATAYRRELIDQYSASRRNKLYESDYCGVDTRENGAEKKQETYGYFIN